VNPDRITADSAQPGDVVLAPDRNVYQLLSRDSGVPVWGSMDPVGFYGPPWNPEGELVLLLRDGTPVRRD
jgi:hypothetical protein